MMSAAIYTTTWISYGYGLAYYLSLAALAALACFVLRRYVKWYFSPLHKLPGPSSSFWLGSFLAIFQEPFLEPHKRWIKKETEADSAASRSNDDETTRSSIKMLHYSQVLGSSSVLILDKDIVKTILTAPAAGSSSSSLAPPRFPKFPFPFLIDIIGNGLLTLDGKDWSRHRRILQPSFSSSFLREQLSRSVPPKVERMIQYWNRTTATQNDKDKNHPPREIDVESHLSALTLDIVGDVGFSHDFHGVDAIETWAKHQQAEASTNDSDDNDSAAAKLPAIEEEFFSSLMKTLKPGIWTIAMDVLGLSSFSQYLNPKLSRGIAALDAAVDQVIANAATRTHTTSSSPKTQSDNGNSSSSSNHELHAKSLLHLMLVAQDPEQQSALSTGSRATGTLSRAELRSNVKTFLLAGHDTTSTWCYWAIFVLAKHADAQERVYQDVRKHVDATRTGEIGLEATEKMVYFQAFLQEVLRLYPPAGIMFRMTTKPETVDGIAIPVGTRLSIPIFLLHRHTAYWGDDPESFRPERWLNVTEEESERRRFAFIPFSAGGRNCIGQRFASIEVQLIMAPLIRAFRFEIAPSQRQTNFTFTTLGTMKSKPLLRIVLKKRCDN